MQQKQLSIRWKQYFDSLLKMEIESIEQNKRDKEFENGTELLMEEIYGRTLDEFRDIIGGMINGKTHRTDTITVELIKIAGETWNENI
jgi:hypothetical protein